jgi:hypothetical protein
VSPEALSPSLSVAIFLATVGFLERSRVRGRDALATGGEDAGATPNPTNDIEFMG